MRASARTAGVAFTTDRAATGVGITAAAPVSTLADHGPGVRLHADRLELDERITYLHPGAHLGAQPGHPTRVRGWDFDDRLVGLDGDQRLVGHDVVPDTDVPRDDLGLGQPLAEVRQKECAHANASTSRAAARIRSVDGR